MTIWLLARRGLRHYALSTAVTASSIALACGLLMSVWVVRTQSHQTFTQVDAGFDAVLGARSSKLQLVLNAIFHLEASPANLAWTDFTEIRSNASVSLAVPIAMGDNYRGFRVVGTTPEMFTAEYIPGQRYRVLTPGRFFDPQFREAVVGSFVARKLGLKRGDTFRPYHGLTFDPDHADDQHEETYTVVGVMEPSNTPADRVIWIPLEGVQTMSGHAAHTATEISAVLVKLRSPMAGAALDMVYNKRGNKLTWAWPIGATMSELLSKIGWFDRVLELVALLVALVAAGTVLAGIHNSMNERRRQIAVLRALGAHRRTVFSAIIFEACLIAALGALLGFAVYAVILNVVGNIIRAETGVVLDPWSWNPVLVWAPLAMIALSALAGLLPAWKGYRVDVAANLGPAD